MNLVKGFTITELMLTLAIISIIGLFAAPSMSEFLERNKVEADTGQIINIINTARSHAISKKSPIIICGDDQSEKCSRNWYQLKVINTSSKEVIYNMALNSRYSAVTWSAFQNKPGLTIAPTGYTAQQNGTLYLCHKQYDSLHRAIVVSKSGRSTVKRQDGETNRRCNSLSK
ncbi:GspH/FimT family pseudopilin [Kangiella spongicola]|uniref:Type II secretion system protein H n=1 Tax=Kangiella spongicola TaxID=796379 RepID=A0A318CZR3_9GAMM|nr:GspH/FimT family pseudopilin [Kangiella spongicola]PXF62456.1 pilus assembly protein FimT [Kangiella spongicola]